MITYYIVVKESVLTTCTLINVMYTGISHHESMKGNVLSHIKIKYRIPTSIILNIASYHCIIEVID